MFIAQLVLQRPAVSFLRHVSTTMSLGADKVAVVLSGCGVYDGSDIHEAVACLAALTRNNLKPVVYAPDVAQAHVINHINGSEISEKRNVLVESSRLAPRAARPLAELKATDVKAVVFLGGFGAAKNLSDFQDASMNNDVTRVIWV